uniref:EGF-like domain-containing protein n=1 Tax=Biomphalaria glabrata TaxID=6526 RepID=A0A2C9LJW1_BIOGL
CPVNCDDCDGIGVCISDCVKGFYGDTCNEACPENCEVCENLTGICVGECDAGFYGELCELRCPLNCLDNMCNRKFGVCNPQGCEIGFYGDYCNL